MKLRKVLLRWFKSFHLNYRGVSERGEAAAYRPWNKMSPPYATGDEFPFIEIPVEHDITTIVGANESGKSHLLNAISKVVLGTGIDGSDHFKRTDLCHYAGVRTRNVEAWPNIGLQFTLENDADLAKVNEAVGGAISNTGQAPTTFALILAPDEDEQKPARLFIEPNEQPLLLDQGQLEKLRKCLPSVQFIDSHALLSSEIPLARLIAAYGDTNYVGIGLSDRRAIEQAVKQLRKFSMPPLQQAVSAEHLKTFEEIKRALEVIVGQAADADSLELLLFKDILGIKMDTLKYLYELSTGERGYVEGQISKWNDEINDRLNLSHFWRQDEQFSVSINYKDGVIYFEIHDKTDSIYTFKERSSGLKFFLSYYIQAKAMEMSSRNRNSIILMDEPDSALSILGQRNLLAVFESLVSPESSNQTCQLVYTTHSPYLINRNFPRRIRVVKKEDAEEGTQYIEQARARRYEPVRTALGIDSAPSLFLGADNILLEGPTDQYLLAEIIRVFATPANVGSYVDLNAVVMVSADGVGNVENVLDQSRWADEPIPPTVVLLDSDKPAEDVAKKITGKMGQQAIIDEGFVAMVGKLVAVADSNLVVVTIEDIVPREIYGGAVKSYVEKWLPEAHKNHAQKVADWVSAVTYGQGGLVASTKELFRTVKPEFGGDYDKMGVLQEVVLAVTSRFAATPDDPAVVQLRKCITAICDFIREGLAKSRAATAKHSTTQAIKRIVNDFNRLNKDNVPITTLQKLFRRLEREVAPIGSDGDVFLRVVHQYLAELEKLRAAGQERVVQKEWTHWKSRIDQIKKNPLAVIETPKLAAMPIHSPAGSDNGSNGNGKAIPAPPPDGKLNALVP